MTDLINEIFPQDYIYKVIKCDKLDINPGGLKFEIELRVNICDKESVNRFLHQFYESAGCTFNMKTGRQDRSSDSESARSQLRGFRKCGMNVCEKEGKENKQPGKNTNCSACLNFRLENSKAKLASARSDKQEFPLWLKINFAHNHSLERADFLKFNLSVWPPKIITWKCLKLVFRQVGLTLR